MTRITNFGRKRTYLEASMGSQMNSSANAGDSGAQFQEDPVLDPGASALPPKKKRKRTPKSKRDGHGTRPLGSAQDGEESLNIAQNHPSTEGLPTKPSKKAKKERKAEFRSGQRRLKRIVEKNATTICFACREKGHAARECPKNESGEGSDSRQVGMCYRCGSTQHTLSRCKKPQDPLNPLPHATCFVCTAKGHLASACPQNKSKGIYPNGGSCKLCGDITHLAKDCAIRKKDTGSLAAVLGIEKNIGADEDDFHTIGRRKQELDRHDKYTERIERSIGVKVAAQSGVMKAFGKAPASAKTVVFF